MPAYPNTPFGSDWQSPPAPSQSPPLHLEGIGSATSGSEYLEVQPVVTESRSGHQASHNYSPLAGPRWLEPKNDEDPPAVKPDPDRFNNSRPDLQSPRQGRFIMDARPSEKKLTPSTDANSASRPKPGGAPAEAENPSEEEEELTLTASEVEENATDVGTAKSPVARPTERRKLKRFRLTHNQTRFLTSEFTRQAHPDVAQRERLSREIPGLSPRQVQVWFQNRRAKLKRLTGDDQERVIKSRAPPEDFDTAQALRSAFGGYPRSVETPLISPTYSTTYVDTGMTRTSLIDGFRRQDDRTTSPNSMHSVSVNYYTSSSSYPASENLSPVSSMSESSHIFGQPASQITSQPSTSPFARSSSFPALYHGYPNIQELQIREEITKQQASSLASPRSLDFSTENSPVPGGHQILGDPGSSYLAQHDQLGSSASDTTLTPSGSGNQAMQDGIFPRTGANALMDSHWQDFQTGGLEFSGAVVPPLPANMEIPQPYGTIDGLPNTLETRTSQDMQNPPLTVDQHFQLQQTSGSQYAMVYNVPYSGPYVEQAPYSNPFPMAQEQLIREQMAGSYSSDVALGTPPQQPPVTTGFEHINNGTKTLRPRGLMGRRRSFTHPMDTSSFR